MRLRSVDITGPCGRLEAILATPNGREPIATAILCHAHPLHGGQMRFKVLYRMNKLLQQAGLAVLRFNFRGVGLSEGTYDHGVGEQDDLRSARNELLAMYPDIPMMLGGFSFGAVVASRVGVRDPGVSSMLLLGFPLARIEQPGYLEGMSGAGTPKLFAVGDSDPYCPVEAISGWLERVSEPRRLRVVPRADHFFTGRLAELEAAVIEWLRSDEPMAPPR